MRAAGKSFLLIAKALGRSEMSCASRWYTVIKKSRRPRGLALQLHFLLKVRSLCFGLVSASPERPCDDASGLDTPLRELEGDTTDFLDRPADQERRLIDRRGNVFLGPTTAALAR